jgi:hypothetical protein
MINWKVLKDSQIEELGLVKAEENEVIMVDPSASPYGLSFMLYSAERVFSEKQLSRYKTVTPTELKMVKEKIEEFQYVVETELNDKMEDC